MTEKSSRPHTNNFKFVLYQGEDVINERIFSADCINPVVRYSVDIRDIIPSITQRLQKLLSRKNLNFQEFSYDFLDYYNSILSLEKEVRTSKLTKPEIVSQTFNGKVIKGVECKFGLYINDKPIVERKIYVDNYNPASRFSTEIAYIIAEICQEISDSLVKSDVNNMWNDYTLINTYGLYVNQIRELTNEKRVELLENVNDRLYVKKTRFHYKSLQPQSQQQQVNTASH